MVWLSQQQIDVLFPAHIAVNRTLEITALGPSLRRRAPWLQPGDHLFDRFRMAAGPAERELTDLADSAGAMVLAGMDGGPMLAGTVVHQPGGFLLTLNYMPTGHEFDLDCSDFAPGDTHLSNLMLIRVQNALIEESRDVAAELATERQRVVDVIDRVGRMSGYLAHDLNNFLSVISLNAKRLLRTEMRDDRQRHCVNVIAETVERCSDFTQGMMTLANQRSDSRLPFAIDAAIEDAAALFRSACGVRITLRLMLQAGSATVNAAASGLINSIINLLINARQAMPSGGTIVLSTEVVSARAIALPRPHPASDFIAITVADEGSGMPSEVLERAFELFYSTKPEGTGVGLASVRDYAEQMDGFVSLSSKHGAGTTARIYLPLVAQRPRSKRNRKSISVDVSPLPLRVLVVDDEEYALEALSEFLEDENFAVTTARSANEAREYLLNGTFDVLVTDVIMQGEDGIALSHWATSHQSGLPVILMSGFIPDAEKLPAEWLFVRKPIDPDLLCQMIQSTA